MTRIGQIVQNATQVGHIYHYPPPHRRRLRPSLVTIYGLQDNSTWYVTFSAVCIAIWFVRSLFLINDLLQSLYWYGFSSVCVSICFCKSPSVWNIYHRKSKEMVYLQYLQQSVLACGIYWHETTFIWYLRSMCDHVFCKIILLMNDLSHRLHMDAFSPVCVATCICKSLFTVNDFSENNRNIAPLLYVSSCVY